MLRNIEQRVQEVAAIFVDETIMQPSCTLTVSLDLNK